MTDNACKISIIIPVYNAEKFLTKCLYSILNQTLKDIELICIDDGSTDNSLNILKQYEEKYKNFHIIKQKHSGPATARNSGIKIAKGEYIGFVDADDSVKLDFFESLYDAAKNSNADIAAGNIIKVYKKRNKYFVKYKKVQSAQSIEDKIDLAKIRTHNYVWNKIYKREELIKHDVKFPDGMLFEDIVFTTKALFYLNKFITVPGANYNYNNNLRSIVNVITSDKQKDYKTAIRMVKEFAIKKGFQLPPNLTMKNWRKYKLFGFFQILKVKEWDYEKKYYFLGFIPFLKVTKNEYEG